MALPAFRWRSTIYLVGMAIITLDCCMRSVQWEEVCMLEITQPIDAIMAHYAHCPVLLDVVAYKYAIMLVMAVDAGLHIKFLQVVGVAGGTVNLLFGVVNLV